MILARHVREILFPNVFSDTTNFCFQRRISLHIYYAWIRRSDSQSKSSWIIHGVRKRQPRYPFRHRTSNLLRIGLLTRLYSSHFVAGVKHDRLACIRSRRRSTLRTRFTARKKRVPTAARLEGVVFFRILTRTMRRKRRDMTTLSSRKPAGVNVALRGNLGKLWQPQTTVPTLHGIEVSLGRQTATIAWMVGVPALVIGTTRTSIESSRLIWTMLLYWVADIAKTTQD